MTVTLELKAEEVRVLQETAQAAGVTIEAVLHALIAQISPVSDAEPERGKVPAGDEAAAEQKREQEEVEANIRRWHEERPPA